MLGDVEAYSKNAFSTASIRKVTLMCLSLRICKMCFFPLSCFWDQFSVLAFRGGCWTGASLRRFSKVPVLPFVIIECYFENDCCAS